MYIASYIHVYVYVCLTRPHFLNTTLHGLHGDVTCNIVSINFHIWYEAR